MTQIVKALGNLIAQLRDLKPSQPVPREALEQMLNAVESLNDDRTAKAELRALVADALRHNIKIIDGVPVVLLRCLLVDTTPEGDNHE